VKRYGRTGPATVIVTSSPADDSRPICLAIGPDRYGMTTEEAYELATVLAAALDELRRQA